nr:Rpn family recombination-promoting nuclease/putative transposase [uncultured Eisenbergiella sp.]
MARDKDLAVMKFLEKPEHFSDLFNGSLFQGKQVLRADRLENLSGKSALSFLDKEGNKVTVRRYRDAVCKASGRTAYAVFAVEGQGETHYAMPVREMLYDAMNYAGQVKILADKHRKAKDYRDSAEFLSGLLREDRLAPVVTICFYYGTDRWEGPLELYDMLDIPEEYEDMKPFIINYKLNLVQASNVDPENFRTDLKHVFSLLGMASDGDGMKRYIQERPEVFRHISYDTFDCLRELLHTDAWWKADRNDGKGGVDMCKALEEIAEMAKKEGKNEGVRIGIKAFVEICEDLGISFEQTVKMVLEKFEVTPEDARGYAEQYRKSNTPQQADGAPNLLRSKPRE